MEKHGPSRLGSLGLKPCSSRKAQPGRFLTPIPIARGSNYSRPIVADRARPGHLSQQRHPVAHRLQAGPLLALRGHRRLPTPTGCSAHRRGNKRSRVKARHERGHQTACSSEPRVPACPRHKRHSNLGNEESSIGPTPHYRSLWSPLHSITELDFTANGSARLAGHSSLQTPAPARRLATCTDNKSSRANDLTVL